MATADTIAAELNAELARFSQLQQAAQQVSAPAPAPAADSGRDAARQRVVFLAILKKNGDIVPKGSGALISADGRVLTATHTVVRFDVDVRDAAGQRQLNPRQIMQQQQQGQQPVSVDVCDVDDLHGACSAGPSELR